MEQEAHANKRRPVDLQLAKELSRLATLMVLVAIVIGLAGYTIFVRQKQDIQSQAEKNLANIAILKVHEIAQWRKARFDDAMMLTEGSKLVPALETWLRTGARDDANRQWMLSRLKTIERSNNYSHLGLLDSQGQIRLASDGNLEHDEILKDLALEAMRTKRTVMSDLHLGDDDRPEIEVIAPLLKDVGGEQHAVGAVYFHIDPVQFLYPLIQSWPTESDTAETLLVSRDEDNPVYLNELRHRKGAALSFALPTDIPDLPGAKARQGQVGHARGLDYRRHSVVAYMLPIPDSTWSLVAKIDENELYATVHQLAVWATGVAIVLLGMSFTALWIEMRRTQLRAYSRQLELEKSLMSHRFEDLSKFANDIFFLMDEEGRIVEVNDRALEVYGYSREEFAQMRGSDLRTTEAARHFSSDWQRLLTEGFVNFETVHRSKNGRNIPIDASMRVLQFDDKRFVQSILRDISARKETERRLHYLAYYDDLTGLPNRTLFIDHFAQAMSAANRSSKRVGVMLLDLDHFKNVNDTLGHESGDMLLHQVSTRLKDCFREGDTLSRFGGDEFAVILADMARSEDAAPVARKILKVFEAPFRVGSHEIFVGVSIGISVYPVDGLNSGELMRNVDAAMYHSKALGRGNFQFYSAELTQRAQQRMALETGLRYAIERNELVLHYQPQIDGTSGAIVGMEALVRWNQPGVGLVSPMEFIPVAEESGLIVPMGEWILRTACAQAKAWQDLGLPKVSIGINISSRQFASGQLVGQVKSVLQQTKLPANYLDLEITESLLIDGSDTVVLPALNEFKSMGINLSIDDFGTGYSSLSYLKRFPIDKLKIDKSFVRGIPDNQENTSLVKTIIAMALNLQLNVIAEGVETEEQRDHLLALDCGLMQGFLFGRPLPSEAATELLKQAVDHRSGAVQARVSGTA